MKILEPLKGHRIGIGHFGINLADHGKIQVFLPIKAFAFTDQNPPASDRFKITRQSMAHVKHAPYDNVGNVAATLESFLFDLRNIVNDTVIAVVAIKAKRQKGPGSQQIQKVSNGFMGVFLGIPDILLFLEILQVLGRMDGTSNNARFFVFVTLVGHALIGSVGGRGNGELGAVIIREIVNLGSGLECRPDFPGQVSFFRGLEFHPQRISGIVLMLLFGIHGTVCVAVAELWWLF